MCNVHHRAAAVLAQMYTSPAFRLHFPVAALAAASAVPSISITQSDMDRAITYVTKIRGMLPALKYTLFLEVLHTFQEGVNTIATILHKITIVFKHRSVLWSEFTQFLPRAIMQHPDVLSAAAAAAGARGGGGGAGGGAGGGGDGAGGSEGSDSETSSSSDERPLRPFVSYEDSFGTGRHRGSISSFGTLFRDYDRLKRCVCMGGVSVIIVVTHAHHTHWFQFFLTC